jgi:hypothetical protein
MTLWKAPSVCGPEGWGGTAEPNGIHPSASPSVADTLKFFLFTTRKCRLAKQKPALRFGGKL